MNPFKVVGPLWPALRGGAAWGSLLLRGGLGERQIQDGPLVWVLGSQCSGSGSGRLLGPIITRVHGGPLGQCFPKHGRGQHSSRGFVLRRPGVRPNQACCFTAAFLRDRGHGIS